MIKLGTNSIGKIYLGSNAIGKAYLGSNLVFQSGVSPTPPQPQPILPTGFTELAYVATDSNAYIDTGVAGATDLEITTKFYVGSYIQYGALYGNYIDGTYNLNRVVLGSETSLSVGGGLNQSQSVSGFSLNAVHTLIVNSTTAILDGNSASLTAAEKTSNTKNICLGNRNADDPVERNIGLRIYAFEIKKGGTTVLNLVPAMRDSDDAVGFYDLVSDSFVKSLTGTEFTAGPANNYAPVEYIETDGVAYINTGLIGVPPKSAEIKMLAVAASANKTILGSLGSATDGEDKKFQMFRQMSAGTISFGYYYNVSGSDGASISNSLTNGTPFEIKGSFKSGDQSVGVKQYGESSFTFASKSYTSAISSSLPMYLFAGNVNGTVGQNLASGTRMYYCKIYSDATYGGLVFDGVPCYYNGQYGLWDKVSGTFKGNSASSGAFSGSSNS